MATERFYQEEKSGSFWKKFVGYVAVGAVGIVLIVAAIDIGAGGLGIPTTNEANLIPPAAA